MVKVASKELKNRLGRYLALVRSGNTVQVTHGGRLIASIIPTGNSETAKNLARLARLIAEGEVRPGTGKLATHKPAVMSQGKTSMEMIAEDRR